MMNLVEPMDVRLIGLEKEVHDVKCYKTMAKYDLLLILYGKKILK